MTATSSTPERSLEQRRAALEAANRIRTYRKQLKIDMKAGRRHVLALVADPPAELLSMRINDLLLTIPKVGRTKALNWCKAVNVSPTRTVGGLTNRQRAELTRLLVSQRIVGICAACGGEVVRLAVEGELASCECGAASIPEAVLNFARRMAVAA